MKSQNACGRLTVYFVVLLHVHEGIVWDVTVEVNVRSGNMSVFTYTSDNKRHALNTPVPLVLLEYRMPVEELETR